jgi:hypothetical protein
MALQRKPLGHNFGKVRIHRGASRSLQPKLAISQPGDKYEREADYVAEQVVRVPDSRLMAHELHHAIQQVDDNNSIENTAMRLPSGQLSGSGTQPNQGEDQTGQPDYSSSTVTTATEQAEIILEKAVGKIAEILGEVRQSIQLTGREDILMKQFPLVDDAVKFAGIDRNAASAWTGSGPRSVSLLLERLRTVLNLLKSGRIFYLQPDRGTMSYCGHFGTPITLCEKANDPYAWACRSSFSVLLCPEFWGLSEDEQNLTIVHEAAHLAYPDLKHSDIINLDNAYCIERIVGVLTDTPSELAMSQCQVPKVLGRPD